MKWHVVPVKFLVVTKEITMTEVIAAAFTAGNCVSQNARMLESAASFRFGDSELEFGPNPAYSRRLIYRLVLGTVFVSMLIWWTFVPSAGEREFRRSQQALRQATSWKEEIPGGGDYEEEMEVSCSEQRSHIVRHSLAPNGISIIDEETRIGPAGYVRYSSRYEQAPQNDSSSEWQHAPYALLDLPCGKLVKLDPVFSLPDYERLIHTAVISKGDIEYIHGAVCRLWKAQIMPERLRGASAQDDEICIGTDDHLPYRFGKRLYYDWNVTLSIDEPTVVERPRPAPWRPPLLRTEDNRELQEPEPRIIRRSPDPPAWSNSPVPPPPPPSDFGDPH